MLQPQAGCACDPWWSHSEKTYKITITIDHGCPPSFPVETNLFLKEPHHTFLPTSDNKLWSNRSPCGLQERLVVCRNDNQFKHASYWLTGGTILDETCWFHHAAWPHNLRSMWWFPVGPGKNPHEIRLGVSKESLDHDWVLKPMVTTGDPPWLKKPPYESHDFFGSLLTIIDHHLPLLTINHWYFPPMTPTNCTVSSGFSGNCRVGKGHPHWCWV